MNKRVILLGWAVAAVLAGAGVWAASRAASFVPFGDLSGRATHLFFDSLIWLPLLAAAVGFFASAFCTRVDPRVAGDKVLRHDHGAMLAHWTTGLSCVVLLYTAFRLGLFSLPRRAVTAGDTAFLLNLHFVGALFFLFGTFFWLGNMVRAPARLKEHAPQGLMGTLKDALIHYAHLFRLTARSVASEKYQASERLAFLPVVGVSLLLIVSGFFKVFARLVEFPAPLMTTMHGIHDICTVLLAVLVVLHVVLGALVPWSWPLLRSMFTGYVPKDYADTHHQAWVQQLAEREVESSTEPHDDRVDLSRRRFVQALGCAGVVVSAGGYILLPGSRVAIPNAGGFLVIDFKKCMGCSTCMTSCAIAHTGRASLSLARIQIQQDPFANWPDDISMSICRQCENAACVKVCPVAANRADGNNGQVRTIDRDRCIGCMQCLEACPYGPKRIQWSPETRTAQKCDLCVDTPFMEQRGGPGGTQACVKACPVNAIAFVTEMPDQTRVDSYKVNLRGEGWAKLGMTRS